MFYRLAITAALLVVISPAWSQSDPPSHSEPGKDASTTSTGQLEDSKGLVVIKIKKAVYPIEAREQQIQGRVWVNAFIAETGDVERVEVVSGDPLLVDAAADAVKKWKFKPYIKGGKAIKVNVKFPVDFAFSDKLKDVKEPPEENTANDTKPASAADSATAPSSASQTATSANPGNVPLPSRVRVSQGVTQGLLLHRVSPVYPEGARRSHIQGKVLLKAVIGTDGNIEDLQVISGPKELVRAAVGAVQQWGYRPYLLMGHPVEVDTTIEVNFTLQY